MHDRIAEIFFPVAMMLALCALVVGCMTTYSPDGTIQTEPADGVVEALQVAVVEAGEALERAQTERERNELQARLGRLREELQRWQEWRR
jgi:hypothetical protein